MITLAILAMLSAGDGSKGSAEAEAEAAKPPPAATQQMCKDVLGRTVRCNPN